VRGPEFHPHHLKKKKENSNRELRLGPGEQKTEVQSRVPGKRLVFPT
jgi:hypothetical protein